MKKYSVSEISLIRTETAVYDEYLDTLNKMELLSEALRWIDEKRGKPLQLPDMLSLQCLLGRLLALKEAQKSENLDWIKELLNEARVEISKFIMV